MKYPGVLYGWKNNTGHYKVFMYTVKVGSIKPIFMLHLHEDLTIPTDIVFPHKFCEERRKILYMNEENKCLNGRIPLYR